MISSSDGFQCHLIKRWRPYPQKGNECCPFGPGSPDALGRKEQRRPSSGRAPTRSIRAARLPGCVKGQPHLSVTTVPIPCPRRLACLAVDESLLRCPQCEGPSSSSTHALSPVRQSPVRPLTGSVWAPPTLEPGQAGSPSPTFPNPNPGGNEPTRPKPGCYRVGRLSRPLGPGRPCAPVPRRRS